MANEHIPVLYQETLAALNIRPGGHYIDCTVGGGGHALGIVEQSEPTGRLLGLDADPEALKVAARRLAGREARIVLINENFVNLERVAGEHGFIPADGILMDLGVSSMQLDDVSRGFSFRAEAPLDMRFGPRQAETAFDVVNNYTERELADLIAQYGEEPRARAIARAIVRAREDSPVETTAQLARIIEHVVPGRGKIHPATRTFQALRIAVNRELENLESALRQAVEILADDGRLAVISFHSLEDRLVKQFFAVEARGCICPPRIPVCVCGHTPRLEIMAKKPVAPSPEEIRRNPRSRSAKLRVARKLARST